MSQETVEVRGVDFEVEFDYQPEEAAVMYYSDGSGYPGCAEEISIHEIKHKGEDLFEFFEDNLEEFENELREVIHERRGR